MIKTRLFTATLMAATAMTAMASQAHAQRIDHIVAFGDSYADDGNLFQFLGIDPVTTLAYPTGRFSGGTNYVDSLSNILNVDVDNFAIGGALTDNNNTNGFPLGFQTEYGSFLMGGGGPAFPTVSGTFDPNDLLVISIGGNDARAYQGLGGTLANAPLAGQLSAANATAGLDLLVAAGAQNISFLAGNTAYIPEVNYTPDPAASFAIRDAYSSAYLAAMRQTLAGYAADGVIVHYLDVNAVGNNVMANYAAFGLTGEACPPDATCIANQNIANQYLFYFDQLHLTSAGFAIIADYIAAQLQAPLTLAASSDMSLDNARQFGRVLSDRMDGGAPRDGDMAEGVSFFIVGDAVGRNGEMTEDTDAFDTNSVGVTAGVEYGFGNGLVGAAARYGRPKADFGNGSSEAEADSISIGAYGSYAMGPIFAQAYAGIGWDNHEVERRGIIDALEREAEMDGDHFVIGGKVGYLTNAGKLRVGPVVSIDYASVDVDGYVEEGDEALNLIVDDVSYSSLRGSVGVELRGDFAGSGVQLRPHAALVLEKELDGDARLFSFSQTASPEIVNSWSVGERSNDAYGRISGGFSAQILTKVRLDVNATATISRPDGDEVGASVGLRIGL